MSILITFTKNWADEFDCDGFKVVHDNPFALGDMFNSLNAWFQENQGGAFEIYFGTNENFVWNSAGEWLESYSIVTIPDEFANFLIENFPNCDKYGYGIFPWPDFDDFETWPNFGDPVTFDEINQLKPELDESLQD